MDEAVAVRGSGSRPSKWAEGRLNGRAGGDAKWEGCVDRARWWLLVVVGLFNRPLTAVSSVDLRPSELAKRSPNLFAQRFDRLPRWVFGIHKSCPMIEWVEGRGSDW